MLTLNNLPVPDRFENIDTTSIIRHLSKKLNLDSSSKMFCYTSHKTNHKLKMVFPLLLPKIFWSALKTINIEYLKIEAKTYACFIGSLLANATIIKIIIDTF